jgi:tRNA G46 methylase TrmB
MRRPGLYFEPNEDVIAAKDNMLQKIVGYHQDDEGHWVADLGCGHGQHVRHQPPMVSRPWVLTEEGRRSFLGTPLNCKRCEEES